MLNRSAILTNTMAATAIPIATVSYLSQEFALNQTPVKNVNKVL